MTETVPAEGTIAYFAHQKEGATYLGALVVVSFEGDPVDFAYTDPVTLNRFSQQLLGARADGYMIGRVLLEPPLKQVKAPGIVCFDEPHLLERRPPTQTPAVVFAAAAAPHKEGHWSFHTVKNGSQAAEGCWVSRANKDAGVLAKLQEAAAAMAPFGIRDPFRQLRAAMAEVPRPAAR
jgi:hypothetical protein